MHLPVCVTFKLSPLLVVAPCTSSFNRHLIVWLSPGTQNAPFHASPIVLTVWTRVHSDPSSEYTSTVCWDVATKRCFPDAKMTWGSWLGLTTVWDLKWWQDSTWTMSGSTESTPCHPSRKEICKSAKMIIFSSSNWLYLLSFLTCFNKISYLALMAKLGSTKSWQNTVIRDSLSLSEWLSFADPLECRASNLSERGPT